MSEQPAKSTPSQAAGETASLARTNATSSKTSTPEGSRTKFKSLSVDHMPKDYAISMDMLRRGGANSFLRTSPSHAVKQPLRGFEPTYVNIVDYVVRITHQIWEEKDIGYIYDTYSHDCAVWDDFGLSYGRDKVVADTLAMNNAFPDLRIVADEVIWAGDDTIGFHTSHRTQIFGTNTGYSRYGEPTGKRVQFWCMANCVALDNEIFHEHVVYDTAGLVQQLGYDVVETAKRLGRAGSDTLLPDDFLSSEPQRLVGQLKPERIAIPETVSDDPEAFVRAGMHTIWNRRNFGALDQVYHPDVLSQGTSGRVFHGTGQLRSFMLSQIAMFPDLKYSVDDLYWMGNPEEGFIVAFRWTMDGTHRGNGRYGEPTLRDVNLWGITHWVIENNRVTKEWSMFNEFGVLMQIYK